MSHCQVSPTLYFNLGSQGPLWSGYVRPTPIPSVCMHTLYSAQSILGVSLGSHCYLTNSNSLLDPGLGYLTVDLA